MIPLEVFLWGAGGSLAVEIVSVNKFMASEHALPDRYRTFGFWFARTLLSIVGGGLAVAYGITQPLLAANIGAATPLIVQALAQGVSPQLTENGVEVPKKPIKAD